ncbi:MAG: cell shape-determining protein MreC [Candidatus Krumholzibacteriia bacterium]|jgi:cell shape-determining protein MreC
MESNLNVLETKVLEAIALIQDLRKTNQRLANSNTELSEQVTELEARVVGVEAENERLSSTVNEAGEQAETIQVYEEKRQAIENRVGGLLEKLEALG